jgi:hypothetical protein
MSLAGFDYETDLPMDGEELYRGTLSTSDSGSMPKSPQPKPGNQRQGTTVAKKRYVPAVKAKDVTWQNAARDVLFFFITSLACGGLWLVDGYLTLVGISDILYITSMYTGLPIFFSAWVFLGTTYLQWLIPLGMSVAEMSLTGKIDWMPKLDTNGYRVVALILALIDLVTTYVGLGTFGISGFFLFAITLFITFSPEVLTVFAVKRGRSLVSMVQWIHFRYSNG